MKYNFRGKWKERARETEREKKKLFRGAKQCPGEIIDKLF